MSNIPRPEYPRPQFVRDAWDNLNGVWQFEVDQGDTGEERGLLNKARLDEEIVVPFCPESKLSGIGSTDFMRAVWYRRAFHTQPEQRGKRVLLHFGAVDYDCTVWVNGVRVGGHLGGYTPFVFDITPALADGENILTVRARDDTRSPMQPTGKQSAEHFASQGCFYTRTTGIWQTVWLEYVNPSYLSSVRFRPDAANDRLYVSAQAVQAAGCILRVETFFDGQPTGGDSVLVRGGIADACVRVTGRHYWNVSEPNLYSVQLTLEKDGQVLDRLDSYAGLRDVRFDGMRFLINERPVFQRLVLDQGFYPDGIYTAPSDEALKNDIALSQAMGFNGARLHQKVFEPRFLYHADHMGYLCWGEMASWGLDVSHHEATEVFLRDWLTEIKRDFSAPSIIGWCPLNETWDVQGRKQMDDVPRTLYRVTKALDDTRPCIDTSGNYHVETDIFDLHEYEQNPDVFASYYGKNAPLLYDRLAQRQTYEGQPTFLSEYGGIWWSDTDDTGWGYGQRPASREEFLDRYRRLTDTLLDNPAHFGFCYTQLTDVEIEQNGLYTYDRKPKFPVAVIRQINARPAACEKEA